MVKTITISHRAGGASEHPVQLPVLGLGVYQMAPGRLTRQAVAWALEAGYRHIDTAALYGNEADVGAAIRASGIPRGEIHVTTKLWIDARSAEGVRRAFEDSRAKLGLEQVDLYLLHAPVAPGAREAVWRGIEALLDAGDVRAIGVSNFGVHHLEELFGYAEVRPSMNQLELSPWLQRRELVAFCRRNDIALTAYSPLTKGRRLGDRSLVALARQRGRTPAQMLIRWSLDQGFVAIPKSARREGIRENAEALDFELTPEELETMAGWEDGTVTGWDPTTRP